VQAIYRVPASHAFSVLFPFLRAIEPIVGKAKNAETLSVHASHRVIFAIEAKAARLGVSKSKYSALILEQWLQTGCPPISEPDRLIQIAAKSEASPKAGKKSA
jgi:hypothetical protein